MPDGDPNKQPPECGPGKLGSGYSRMCPNLKLIYESFSGERYGCDVCGERYFLDYDEMA